MLFNSATFILFFGTVLLLHNLPFSWRVKKFNLLWLSYLFYAAWNPPFVLLLMLSTVIDWFAARGIYQARTTTSRRLWLGATLGVNLGVLGYFKYGTFLVTNFVTLLHALGVEYHPAKLDIFLPIGISFYTFVTLSYTLDVYWGRMKPWDSFLDFAMFVTFFPHLVAGPILRAADFLPQCQEPKRPSHDEFCWGLSLLCLGLFEKVVLADAVFADAVEQVYGASAHVPFYDAWAGTLAFAGQIFCDFAGYSTCAIGVAACLGFWLPRNFNCPYGALGFSDFWRRWHISLSTWLRDYLYIPLGGNRHGPKRTYVNLLITMLLGGLWHGAAWTFVIWGALHGLYLAGERLVRSALADRPLRNSIAVQLAGVLGTFLLVCLAWVFFRARGLDQAFALLSSMLGAGSAGALPVLRPHERISVLVVTLLLLTVHWTLRHTTVEEVVAKLPWWTRSAALAALVIFIGLTPAQDRAFIYFQF